MNQINKLARTMGVSLSEIARRVDMQPHTLRRYARNESQPKHDLALKLSTVFGCDPSEVMGFAAREPIALAKIPLYGSAEGGIGSDITNMDRAIDHIDRPSFLLSASSAYAVYVVGDSMAPRFRSGEIVYVDPAVPIRRGTDCVVQIAEDGVLTAIIKEYVSSTETKLTLRQYNPDKEIIIDANNVTNVHLVRGMYIT